MIKLKHSNLACGCPEPWCPRHDCIETSFATAVSILPPPYPLPLRVWTLDGRPPAKNGKTTTLNSLFSNFRLIARTSPRLLTSNAAAENRTRGLGLRTRMIGVRVGKALGARRAVRYGYRPQVPKTTHRLPKYRSLSPHPPPT